LRSEAGGSVSTKEKDLVAIIEAGIASLTAAKTPSPARESQLKEALRCTQRALVQQLTLSTESPESQSVADDAAKSSATSPNTAPAEESKTMSFLFAMDNELLRKVISSMIKKRGHLVTTIDSPEQIITQLTTDTYDLVLIDMTDSSSSQIDRLKKIRAYDEEQMEHTPVIALTAQPTAIDDSFDEWVGLLDAYLPAPIGADRFFFTVERVLARSVIWS